MPYKYKIWCPYCLYEDYDGCFEGQSKLSDKEYNTIPEAELAVKSLAFSVWEFTIVDSETHQDVRDWVESGYLVHWGFN